MVFDLEGGRPKAIPTIASLGSAATALREGEGGREMDLGLGSAISHSLGRGEGRATKECLLGHSDCSAAPISLCLADGGGENELKKVDSCTGVG